MGKIRYYNFLYSLCCNLTAVTRNLNWLNLLVHCLPGSNSNTGFQACLYHCRIMADFQLCCVRTNCSFLSSKKIQTTPQKTTPGTSLTIKGDGWFRLSPMGMWRLLITLLKEGFFSHLLWRSLSSFNDAFFVSIFLSFFFLSIFSLFFFLFFLFFGNWHFGNKSSILCHTVIQKWKNKNEKTIVLLPFFVNKIIFINARNSKWAWAVGINSSWPFCIKLRTEIKSEKKKNLIPGVHYMLNSLAILIKMELIRFPAMFVYSLIYIVRWFIYSLIYSFHC